MNYYDHHKNILNNLFNDIKFINVDGNYTQKFYNISVNIISNLQYNCVKKKCHYNSYFDYYLFEILSLNNVQNINELVKLKYIKQPDKLFTHVSNQKDNFILKKVLKKINIVKDQPLNINDNDLKNIMNGMRPIYWITQEVLKDLLILIKDSNSFMLCHKYTYYQNSETYNVFFYYPSYLKDDEAKFFDKINKYVMYEFIILPKINQEVFKKINNYNIWFIVTRSIKKFNYSDNKIHMNEINSGETLKDITIIYRLEESLKVALHELCHAFGIIQNDKFINNDFAYNYDKIALSESIVETIANLFNCLVNSNNYNQFIKNIELEIKFGLLQVSKILYKTKINNIEYFFDHNNFIKIIQETASVEYYIFKTFLLYNLDNFLDIIFNSKNIIQLYREIYQLILKIKDTKTNKWLLYNVNKSLDFIKNNINNQDDKIKELITTSRMTIIDIKNKENDIVKNYSRGYRIKCYRLIK